MSKLWIMVADASVARIYAAAARGAALHLVDTIEHPEGRLRGQDLVTDRPGSNTNQSSPSPHGYEPHTPAVDVVLDRFALQLADHLDAGRRQNSFEGLVLAMPPRLLGRVKAALTKETTLLLQESFDQRLVDLDERALSAFFQAHA